MTELAKIVGVAIVYDGKTYTLPKPNRQHDVIRSIPGGIGGPHKEGFIDAAGKFLNRKQAMARAEETGQLNRRPGKEFYQGPELYSEDLW